MTAVIVNPSSLAAPRGYSHGVLLGPGRTLFVAGQIGWSSEARLVGPGFVDQFDAALRNVMAVVRAAGGQPNHVGRFTIYVTDRAQYLANLGAIGQCYQKHMGRFYPAMALVQVAALLEASALVEIEATAIIPEDQATR